MSNQTNANWIAPPNVFAVTTNRANGVSLPPYDSNNMGLHVGDNPKDVQINRQRLISQLNLPSEPVWLDQTHSIHCIVVEEDDGRTADAAITRQPSTVLAIMTADCLPITLCNKSGTEIAAIHAGWRGLANGIIDETVRQMKTAPSDLIAWVGPAICKQCYRTGEEVLSIFQANYPFTHSAFHSQEEQWHADLALIAELVLRHLGLTFIYQSNECTFEYPGRYYSYRHASQTGRMATLVWME